MVAGLTFSADFPGFNATQGFGGVIDVFVTRLGPTGQTLVYSTYLGGLDDDEAFAVAMDASGSAYVTGYTCSAGFPTQGPFQGSLGSCTDTFVTKLSAPTVFDLAADFSIASNPNGVWTYGTTTSLGSISIGGSTTKTVTIQNAGQGTLTGSVTGSLSTPFTLLGGGGSFSLAPGATHTITVQFSPSARGTARGALTVASDDPARPSVRMPMTGIVR